MMIVAFLSFAVGLILDTVVRSWREVRRGKSGTVTDFGAKGL
jgi:hypothetical protein